MDGKDENDWVKDTEYLKVESIVPVGGSIKVLSRDLKT